MIYSILCWIALVIAVVAAEEVNIASKADFARRFHDSLTVDKPNYSHVRELLEAINDEDQILATEVMAVGDKLVPFPPMAHHLLNLHMIAKSPKDKEIIIDLLSLAIKKGLDVNALFRDDPPLFFKCLISKEFNLFVQVLNAGRKVFINQVIGRSRWVVQALNILYALPSEVVPIAKLLLHVEQRVHREENLSTSLNRTEVALSLLRGARLDKPTVRAEELWVHSETFRDLVLHISGMQYTSFTGAELVPLQDARLDPDRSKVLLLKDVAATLDELVNSMQKEIFHIILTDSRGGIALMHFLDMLVTPNQQGRNAFHFLSMSAAHHTLTTILNQYSLDMGESVSYDTHILAALSRADYRNHSALSYCQYRFHGQAAHCSLFDKVLRRNSAASQSPGGHLGADVGVDGELVEVESPAGNIQNNYSETGGWNPTLLEVLPVHVGQRCDIEEVWDADKLPPSPEFFERYINQGRPVIFRGVGKKHTEYMNVVNRNLDRARFLRRYGATKVPASVLPYGDSFGVSTITTTVKEVAASPPYSATNSTAPPLYIFLTPPAGWATHMNQDIPVPAPLVNDVVNTLGQVEKRIWQHELQFYLGSAGTGAPVHFHGHAINTLAHGEKHWVLFPPEQAFYSTLPALAFFQKYVWSEDTPIQSLLHPSPPGSVDASPPPPHGMLQCVQRAGDIMYVPSLWSHGTLNVRQSIGVAHEFSVESFCME